MTNVTVLMGSPRKSGNTSMLVDNFVKGLSADVDCEVINVASLNIHPCIGCNSCFRNSRHKCCQADDMDGVYERLNETDVLVIASPVYFYGVSSQLKSLIDRLHNPIRDTFRISKMGLLLVGAASLPNLFDPILMQYKMCLSFFNLESIGEILVPKVKDAGDIKGNGGLLAARKIANDLD